MTVDRQSRPKLEHALKAYSAVFSGFIIWASARTMFNPGPHGAGIQSLAAIEIVGAFLFAFQKTRFFGLVVLLAVFTVAATIELHLWEMPLRFVFYAASALFIQYLSGQTSVDR